MSDDQPRCLHCNAVIPPGMGWRENGLLFQSREHADDFLTWLESLADEIRGTGG